MAHRAPDPNFAVRRVVAAIVALVVVGGLVWFFFLRDDDGGAGDGNGTGPLSCEDFRAELLSEYRPMRKLQADIIDALAPVDAGEDLSEEQITQARTIVEDMKRHRARIEALSTQNPPQALQQDMFSLVPTLNEFTSLSRRTVEWLEGTVPSQPTETPSVQLQSLYDSLPPPARISACA